MWDFYRSKDHYFSKPNISNCGRFGERFLRDYLVYCCLLILLLFYYSLKSNSNYDILKIIYLYKERIFAVGFLDELHSNAKTRSEFEKEQLNQKIIEEKMHNIELQNAENARIMEFKQNLQPFIEIIKDVCLKASQQGIYINKENRRIINGYIFINEVSDKDGDQIGIRYSCNAYTLKKRHIFNEDEYNIVADGMTFTTNKYGSGMQLLDFYRTYFKNYYYREKY